MDDLIAFLRARLDADEQAASKATEGPWSVGESDTNGGCEVYSEEGGVAIQGHYGGGVPKRADAEHIVRHDPARVLCEVDVKRRLLDLHQPEPLNEWDRKSYGFTLKCAGESWECYGDGEDIVPWPCDHLKLLALPYADHKDYREAWRP